MIRESTAGKVQKTTKNAGLGQNREICCIRGIAISWRDRLMGNIAKLPIIVRQQLQGQRSLIYCCLRIIFALFAVRAHEEKGTKTFGSKMS